MAIDRAALRSINSLKRSLQRLPVTSVARIAERAAPAMTELAGGAYDSGQTVYGAARPRAVDGHELTLHRTGASRRAAEFRATGRDIRTLPLPRYFKYLIAKYSVLPPGKSPLSAEWKDRLAEIAAQVLYDMIHSDGGGQP